MKVYSKIVEVKTYGPIVLHSITSILIDAIRESGIREGVMWVSVEGATPALLMLSKGIEKNFLEFVTRFIPLTGWRHGNAYAHLISTIFSTNLVIPIIDGFPVISDNEVYLLETRSVYNHVRRIVLQVHGV